MKLLVKKYFAESGVAYLQEIKATAKLFTSTDAREIRVKMFIVLDKEGVAVEYKEGQIIEEDIKILDTFKETTKVVLKDKKKVSYTNRLYDWE